MSELGQIFDLFTMESKCSQSYFSQYVYFQNSDNFVRADFLAFPDWFDKTKTKVTSRSEWIFYFALRISVLIFCLAFRYNWLKVSLQLNTCIVFLSEVSKGTLWIAMQIQWSRFFLQSYITETYLSDLRIVFSLFLKFNNGLKN